MNNNETKLPIELEMLIDAKMKYEENDFHEIIEKHGKLYEVIGTLKRKTLSDSSIVYVDSIEIECAESRWLDDTLDKDYTEIAQAYATIEMEKWKIEFEVMANLLASK
jgi:hypothetical protein